MLHCTNLSDQAFVALLDALGLQNDGNQDAEDLRIYPCATLSCNSYGGNLINTVPLSASTNSVPARTRRPVKKTRPPALYLPNGLPFSFNASITESIRTPETPNSGSTESPPGSAASTWDSDSSICVKAAFNATIIMLRASRATSFAELKQRLYDKFVKQEGLCLSRRLTVVSVRPPPNKQGLRSSSSSSISTLSSPSWVAGALCRIGRVQKCHSTTYRKESSSLEPRRFSFAELTHMHFIEDEVDWQKILARHYADGTKVTLRILDTPI